MKPCFILFAGLALYSLPLAAHSPRMSIDPGRDRHPISPWIYGTNAELRADDVYQSRRFGGNRTTAWNWFTNASNAGSDWKHSSDSFLSDSGEPGQAAVDFQLRALKIKVPYSLMTLPMAGYVAADKSGTVTEAETAPSKRWLPLWPDRQTAKEAGTDTSKPAVFMEDFVQFLLGKFGPAGAEKGIRGYCLDNEPALWKFTHSRMHPQQPTCDEVLSKGIATARMVKRLDPGAEVFGPEAFGFPEYYDNSGAPDWSGIQDEASRQDKYYRWYLDWYLEQFKAASDAAGVRLLDVLSIHWYPEVRIGGVRITEKEDTKIQVNRARMQAPRSLWDATYIEDSWLKRSFAWGTPLLPLLKESIDTWNPGTKLAFTEYNYGGNMHISGGIAQADVLGIFGRHGVYFATLWPNGGRSDYVSAAFRLYRNADGKGTAFGDTSVWSETSDPVKSCIHASLDAQGRLHLILINKSEDSNLETALDIGGTQTWQPAGAWGFDQTGSRLQDMAACISTAGGKPQVRLPPLSVCHIVLEPR